MLRLRRDLDMVFRQAKPVRGSFGKLSVRILFRERTSQTAAAIQYLFVAPKRNIRHANERNKIKRWLREAVRTSELEKQIQETLRANDLEALVMIRVYEPPSATMNWTVISEEIPLVFEAIAKVAPKQQ